MNISRSRATSARCICSHTASIKADLSGGNGFGILSKEKMRLLLLPGNVSCTQEVKIVSASLREGVVNCLVMLPFTLIRQSAGRSLCCSSVHTTFCVLFMIFVCFNSFGYLV